MIWEEKLEQLGNEQANYMFIFYEFSTENYLCCRFRRRLLAVIVIDTQQ